MSAQEKEKLIENMTAEMKAAAKRLDFELAAYIRDRIAELKKGYCPRTDAERRKKFRGASRNKKH